MSDLDRKLAEALGWTVDTIDETNVLRFNPADPSDGLLLEWLSTTWDGAGLVVQAMRSRGYGLLFQCSAGSPPFYASFNSRPYERWNAGINADTAPEAIAKAALAALEQADE